MHPPREREGRVQMTARADRRRLRFGCVVALMALLGVGSVRAAETPPKAPEAPFTTVDGSTHSTSELKGSPTLLWLLSTWCGSCAAGLDALSQHTDEIAKTDLRVVVLRNYQNGGYPGADIAQFVSRVLPRLKVPERWMLGQASAGLDRAYNGKHYPDIYFLIDRQGRVRQVGGAPSATMDRILRFARSSGRDAHAD